MKQGFYFFILMIIIGFMVPNSWEEPTQRKVIKEEVKVSPDLDFVVHIDNKGNAFSGSLTHQQILELHRNKKTAIVRLSGNTKNDIGYMSISEEARICDSLTRHTDHAIQFYYMNIEGRILESGEDVSNLMKQGGVVVHCRNGKHRAPAMAAYFLMSKGYDKKDVVSIVGWEKLILSPGPYLRYLDVL